MRGRTPTQPQRANSAVTVPASVPWVASIAAASGGQLWAYVGFFALVILFLALDLGVFHREAHEVSMREAVAWTVVWLGCGLAFAAFVYFAYENHWLDLGLVTPKYNTAAEIAAGGPLIVQGEVAGTEALNQYLTGYLVEKSLAIDNIFVIALVFAFFAVPARYQHRVLFWGIVGALVLRGTMILVGGEFIREYQWILIVFGLFLLLTALKMALIRGHDDPAQNLVVRLAKRLFRTVDFYDGQRFFTKRTIRPTYSRDPATGRDVMDPPPPGTLAKRWAMTPLFLALVMVEITDVVFAVDSVPAIFAITPDPFIVLTSNLFAILGLRALYFCLAAMLNSFRFLKPALILILGFVGVKLLLLSVPPYLGLIGAERSPPIKIDTTVSLLVILGTLAAGVAASLLWPKRAAATP